MLILSCHGMMWAKFLNWCFEMTEFWLQAIWYSNLKFFRHKKGIGDNKVAKHSYLLIFLLCSINVLYIKV